MISKIYRSTWAEVNLDNIMHNILYLRENLPNKKIMAVVKANGYGHGDIEVARASIESGCEYLAVAFLDEALWLREHFKDVPILVMGVTNIEDIDIAASNNITITAHDKLWIREYIKKIRQNISMHIKVDTGMHRLGLTDIVQIKDAINLLSRNEYTNLDGIFTHFATASGYKASKVKAYKDQLNRFYNILDNVSYDFNIVHVSNSAASLKYEVHHKYTNAVRFGISMYGLKADLLDQFPIKPALALYSKITQIKILKKGESVGYGYKFKAKKDLIIGVVPAGYADGIIRKNQNRDVVINNKIYKIVGRVCMDQLFVLIDKSVKVDDIVTLMGDNVDADYVSKHLDTINYEITCSISDRVPRIYIKDNQQIKIRYDRFNKFLELDNDLKEKY